MVGTPLHELPVELNQVGESRRYVISRGVFLRLLASKAYEFPEYRTFVNVNHRCVTMNILHTMAELYAGLRLQNSYSTFKLT